MSDTYNILKKYAYWEGVQDPVYGVDAVWRDGDAPKGYISPFGMLPENTLLAPALGTDKKGRSLYPQDVALISSILMGQPEQQLFALNIYHKLVRGALFDKSDEETVQLANQYPYLWQEAAGKAKEIKANNPKLYHLFLSSGKVGENLVGSEVDYLADVGLLDKVKKKLNDSPSTKALSSVFEPAFENLQNAQRKRTNSYAFSNYVPGMLAAGLVPTAIGAFMGRPILGAVLGAILSGGLGYYGYNKMYNPNFKGYDWLDNGLSWMTGNDMSGRGATHISDEAQSGWNSYQTWLQKQQEANAAKLKPATGDVGFTPGGQPGVPAQPASGQDMSGPHGDKDDGDLNLDVLDEAI